MLRRTLFTAAVALAGVAQAETLFSNIGDGISPTAPIFSGQLSNRTLEDVTFGSTNPQGFTLTALNVGFDNTSPGALSFDVLVDFYDTVDYGAASVASSLLAGDIRLPVINSIAGANDTMPLALPAIFVPDNNIGVAVRFVQPNTFTPATEVLPLFKDVPIEVGTSNALFANDANNNNIFAQNERFTWEGGGFPAANMYLQVYGEAVVPEPTLMSALLPVALLARRR